MHPSSPPFPRTDHPAPQTHAVLVARGHVLDVAEAYDAIGEQLVEAGRRGNAQTQPTSRPPLDLHLAGVRMEIESWATFLARALMDEAIVERYVGTPWAQPVVVEPWSPPASDAAAILREIAERRLGHFLAADPLVAAEFLDAAEGFAHRSRAAAWPTGARWIRLHVACPEVGTDDAGRRVPCGGEYRMWMRPDQDVLGDMVCDRDGAHRITPAEWQRAMRRRPVDEAAAARLVRTIRLAGRAAS